MVLVQPFYIYSMRKLSGTMCGGASMNSYEFRSSHPAHPVHRIAWCWLQKEIGKEKLGYGFSTLVQPLYICGMHKLCGTMCGGASMNSYAFQI